MNQISYGGVASGDGRGPYRGLWGGPPAGKRGGLSGWTRRRAHSLGIGRLRRGRQSWNRIDSRITVSSAGNYLFKK